MIQISLLAIVHGCAQCTGHDRSMQHVHHSDLYTSGVRLTGGMASSSEVPSVSVSSNIVNLEPPGLGRQILAQNSCRIAHNFWCICRRTTQDYNKKLSPLMEYVM